jgi:hypothetical protein
MLCDTSVYKAALAGDYNRVKFLLETGRATVRQANCYGLTALHYAAMKGHARLCELLVRAGADPALANPLGQTPGDLGAAFDGVQEALRAGDEARQMRARMLEAMRTRVAREVEEHRRRVGEMKEWTRGTTAALYTYKHAAAETGTSKKGRHNSRYLLSKHGAHNTVDTARAYRVKGANSRFGASVSPEGSASAGRHARRFLGKRGGQNAMPGFYLNHWLDASHPRFEHWTRAHFGAIEG